MLFRDVPFRGIDWTAVTVTEHPGAEGKALWRTLEVGNLRVRLVEYSAGYVADHWCQVGHVLHVLDGTLATELEDGTRVDLRAGQTYIVDDSRSPHRSSTTTGARLFIVDEAKTKRP